MQRELSSPAVRHPRSRGSRQHADRAAQLAPARGRRRHRAGERRRRRRPRRAVAQHRRPRHRDARRSGRRPRGDRKPCREFLRWRRRAGAVAGHCRTPWRRTLQGDQHRRQHDRPPHAALPSVRLGGGAARRSGQLAGVAALGAAARCGRGVLRRRLGERCVAHGAGATPRATARPMPAIRKRRWPARSDLSLAGPRVYGGVLVDDATDGQWTAGRQSRRHPPRAGALPLCRCDSDRVARRR